MRTGIKVGNREIGEGRPCFVIAEAGVNHNGSLEIAKKLVDVAKEAGADAVKFQTFKTENLVTDNVELAPYQKKNLSKSVNQLQMLKELELDYKKFKEIKEYCDKKEIMFLSTPHTDDAIDFLDKLVPLFKLSSGELTNLPFLEKVAKKSKPLILSTGAGTLEEVKEAIDIIKKTNKDTDLILLHCTISYPCERQDVNLKSMETIRNEFNVLVGYSDHTLGIEVPLMAVKMGAVVIEKHFTIDKNMEGPDHKCSLNPKELKEMIEKIKKKEILDFDDVVIGSDEKKPTKKELELIKIVRKSIVAKQDIPKGTIISEDMLAVKRPGTGLAPKYLTAIIGKTTKKDLQKNELITEKVIKWKK